MAKIRLDTYYDVTCSNCAQSRSTDFAKGMEVSKARLSKQAYEEGWKNVKGQTLCPSCVKKLSVANWERMEDLEPPVRGYGIELGTEECYYVLCADGAIVYGRIYKNDYSATGYAVDGENDFCYNNVTHWAPDGLKKCRK